MSISDADLTMCVDDRCTIVTSAPCSHSAPQMSKAELLRADDDGLLARVRVRAGVLRGVVLLAAEDVHAGQAGMFGLPDMPVAKTSCCGVQLDRLAVAVDDRRVHSRPSAS